MKDVILVGMMGSGKSSVGKRLAEAAGCPFQDTDAMLQRRLGRPVHQLFRLYGEEAFRQHETSLLRSLQPPVGVMATGGGIVLKDENWTEMRRLGLTLFLKTAPQLMLERLAVSRKKRPLLEVEGWEDRFLEIYERRKPLYERADVTVAVDTDDFDAVIERILELLK